MVHLSSDARVRARRLPLLLIAAVLVPGLAACGSDDDSSSASTGTTAAETTTAETNATEEATTTTEDEAEGGECKTVEAPEPRTDEPSLPKPKPAKLTGVHDVTIATNCGSFTIRLDTKRQPKTAASFNALVKGKFYDGLTFHRLATGFVIQGGDPNGDGTGGPGYKVVETPPSDAAYTRGVVAMAKAGNEAAGTSGSQFFVVTGDDTGLPPDYAIVGKVTKGMDTVQRIADVGSAGPPADTPLSPVVISKATTSEK